MPTSLNDKQIDSIVNCTKRLNIWSGSVRSGKTVASYVAWMREIRNGPPGPLLMVGKTFRTLKRNVLDPMHEFLGNKRMVVNSGTGESKILGRTVYMVGANDERAESKIRGVTLAGAYGDELTTWPASFFKMLLSRLSVPGAKLLGTTNPDAPLHWLKKEFLDRIDVLDLNLFAFKLTDNTFLGQEYIDSLKNEYTGLWRKRYIDGLWIAAEGPIYDMFDPDVHTVSTLPDGIFITEYWVAIDYGTANPFVALLFGLGSDKIVYVLSEWRWDSSQTNRQMTDSQYRLAVEGWLKETVPTGASVDVVYVDPSAASFIAECTVGWLPATQAVNDVIDGIRYVSTEIANGRLKILHTGCPSLTESLPGYAWDQKKQLQGKDEPLKINDHDADALRYGIYSDACQRINTDQVGWELMSERWTLRQRMFNFAVAGVESVFGVTFRHTYDNTYAQAWMRGIESLLCSAGAMERPYTQHPIVHQAIRTVAEDGASIAWQAYPAKASSKEKAIPLDSHSFIEWLERPGPGLTRKLLFETTTIHYLLDGEFYWYYPDLIIQPKGMPEAGRLRSGGLELLRRGDIRWDKSASGEIKAIRKSDGGVIDLEKVTCFKSYNPYGFHGASVMETLYTDTRADYGAALWNAHMLADRNGMPNVVLKPPAEKGGTPKERRETKEKWESSFPTSRSGVGILPAGWDLSELGTNRRDMEYNMLRDSSRELILGGVGLVPFLAGVLDKANYANAREQKFVYWRGTIARLLARYEDMINNDMLPKLNITDVKIFPQWETVRAMADDVEQKSRIAQQWFNLGISKKAINEGLEMGWDEEDMSDYEQGYLPASYIPVELAGEMSLGPTAPAEDGEDEEKDEPKKLKETAAQRADRKLTLWRLHVIRLRILEKPTEMVMRSWYRDVEQAVLLRVESLAGHHLATLGIAATSDDLNNVLFEMQKAVKELLNKMTPRIKAGLSAGGESVMTDAGIDQTFNPNDMRVAAKLVEQQLRVRSIASTVRDQLRETLQEGINKGESAAELAKRVSQTMDVAMSRAKTVARTEMGTAYSNGRYVGMKQARITQHEWLSARDDLVRPTHEADDGEAVDVGTPFPNTGLLYPLDPSGEPEEVINCRCTTLPVVTED